MKVKISKQSFLILIAAALLLLIGLITYLFINKQKLENSDVTSIGRDSPGCKEIIMASPSPTPYDPNSPFSHKVIKDGIYVDFIQGYCFKFPRDEFIFIDGWLTSPKGLIETSEGEKTYNFHRPYLTLSVGRSSFVDDEYNNSRKEAIKAPIGSIVKYESLMKVSDKYTAEFERATFFLKLKDNDFYKRVGYRTIWFLYEKNMFVELDLYASPDFEEDLRSFEQSYYNIVESMEFF